MWLYWITSLVREGDYRTLHSTKFPYRPSRYHCHALTYACFSSTSILLLPLSSLQHVLTLSSFFFFLLFSPTQFLIYSDMVTVRSLRQVFVVAVVLFALLYFSMLFFVSISAARSTCPYKPFFRGGAPLEMELLLGEEKPSSGESRCEFGCDNEW